MAFDPLSHPLLFIPVVAFLGYVIFTQLTAKSTTPPNLPWVGRGEGFFSLAKARWRAMKNLPTLLNEGYTKYNKLGKYVLLPVPFSRVEVLIPPARTSWLLAQPDRVLSSEEVHKDIVQPGYAFLNFHCEKYLTHETIIRRDLTRQLGSLTEDIMEELSAGFDEYWGTDTCQWKEVGVFETMRKIVARTSNRVFIGLPLCRNEKYITNVMALSQEVVPISQLIRLFPWFIRPLAARIITIPNRIHRSRALKHALPVVKQRLADMHRAAIDPAFSKTYTRPNDFLTWTIADAQHRNDVPDLDPEVIACRILMTNFVAIETSTNTATSAIFDLVSSDPKQDYLGGIADEATRIFAENGNKWTKMGLSNMIRVDSAVKETLRLNMSTKALTKEVALPEGITLEDGLHLPQGARMSVSSYGVHRDPDHYPNGEVYDAFRFSRIREGMEAKRVTSPTSSMANDHSNGHVTSIMDKDRTTDLIREKNLSAVSTSESFLSFGHSRHACPGRFFAANEIKLLLAYMSIKYEIEPLKVKPKGMTVAEFVVPDMKETIRVRRRKVEGC